MITNKKSGSSNSLGGSVLRESMKYGPIVTFLVMTVLSFGVGYLIYSYVFSGWTESARAYREQVVSLAQGDAQRFVSIFEAYRNAPDVTSRRMYLETMEQVLRGTNKIIIDGPAGEGGQGVVPYLPLEALRQARPPQAQQGGQPPGQPNQQPAAR